MVTVSPWPLKGIGSLPNKPGAIPGGDCAGAAHARKGRIRKARSSSWILHLQATQQCGMTRRALSLPQSDSGRYGW